MDGTSGAGGVPDRESLELAVVEFAEKRCSMILDDLPADLKPIFRMIDNFDRPDCQ